MGRWIGAVMLLHFAVVFGVKVAFDISGEILWMSHVSLLLAGLGLLLQTPLLVTTALTTSFVLHSFWLIDALWWMAFGTFPMGITTYLETAGLWTWVATSHHFYLVPLLLIIVARLRKFPPETLLASVAVFLILTILSRFLDPARNINYAFGVKTTLDSAFLNWANRLPGGIYLPGLNAFVSALMFVPVTMLMRAWINRSRPHPPHGRRKGSQSAVESPTSTAAKVPRK